MIPTLIEYPNVYDIGESYRTSMDIGFITGLGISGVFRSAFEQARPGRYRTSWDIHDDAGRRVPGGAYAFRLIAGDFRAARSMAIPR